MSFPYSNGLPGQIIITPQTKNKGSCKAVQKIVSGKGNKGNKTFIKGVSAPTPVTKNTGVVAQIPNFPSATATIPFSVTDSNNLTYTTESMVNINPQNPGLGYYILNGQYSNSFLFGNTSSYGTITYNPNSIGNYTYNTGYAPNPTTITDANGRTYSLVVGNLLGVTSPASGLVNIYRIN